jgi:hypothetical protein
MEEVSLMMGVSFTMEVFMKFSKCQDLIGTLKNPAKIGNTSFISFYTKVTFSP